MLNSSHVTSIEPTLPRWHTKRFWLLTFVACSMVALTFSLGRWQLNRADYKLNLSESVSSRGQQPSLDQNTMVSSSDQSVNLHRRVTLQGQWMSAHIIYLDNRPMQGKPGFWVFTPLKLSGSTRMILIQRGWVPRDFFDRNRLWPVQTPDGLVEVTGRMALSPGKLYDFKGEEFGQIRQNISIERYRLETGLDLLDAFVIQTGEQSQGLQRQWDSPSTGVDKHHGYAFQWFALSALLTGLYCWFQLVSPLLLRKKSKRLTD